MKTFDIIKLLREQGETQANISNYLSSTMRVSKANMDQAQVLEHFHKWNNKEIYDKSKRR